MLKRDSSWNCKRQNCMTGTRNSRWGSALAVGKVCSKIRDRRLGGIFARRNAETRTLPTILLTSMNPVAVYIKTRKGRSSGANVPRAETALNRYALRKACLGQPASEDRHQVQRHPERNSHE